MISEVSVVIPTYNRKEKLLLAVTSVLNQTYAPLEILVCDDGSTDGTKEVIEELKSDIPVLYLNCGRNGLPAVPRNIGVSKAKGNYIAFLDDDDEWLPDKLKIQLAYMEKTGALICGTNAFRITDSAEKLPYFNFKTSVFTFEDCLVNNPLICSSVMVKTDFLRQTGTFAEQPEFRAVEDYLLWLKLSVFYSIHVLENPLVNYRDVPQSSIRKEEINEDQRKILLLNETKKFIEGLTINTKQQKLQLIFKMIRFLSWRQKFPFLFRILRRIGF